MGLEKVKEEIVEEAEEKAGRKVQEAEEEAERMVEEAEERAEEIKSEAREKARKEAEAKINREISSARIDSRRKKLEAKKEVVDSAFDLFEEKVRGINQEEKAEMVQSLLEDIRSDMEVGRIWTSEYLANSLELDGAEVDTGDLEGIVVENAEGSIKQDYSFETLIEKVKEESRKDISSILFGEKR